MRKVYLLNNVVGFKYIGKKWLVVGVSDFLFKFIIIIKRKKRKFKGNN